MKKTAIIFLILFPFLGNAQKPIDVSIELPADYPRDMLADFQNMLSVDWCDFYQDEKTHNYYLRKADIHVGVDNYNDCWQDSTVSVYSIPNSLFLINGLKPRKQPVKTVFLPEENILAGKKQSFDFGGKTYTFRAEAIMPNGETFDYWNDIKDYKLYFSEEKSSREQLLITIPQFNNTMLKILWIGDLDRDGKPDFLLDISDFYETTKVALFLSSTADRRELVKLAAEAMYSYDC
ncbi:MAG: hypothetical protein LBK94_07705 [Prevotellaceae bacterium]|jgi:hypothetical protein|nr:hypothetical protein [Prevotellaceae bacterium]